MYVRMTGKSYRLARVTPKVAPISHEQLLRVPPLSKRSTMGDLGLAAESELAPYANASGQIEESMTQTAVFAVASLASLNAFFLFVFF